MQVVVLCGGIIPGGLIVAINERFPGANMNFVDFKNEGGNIDYKAIIQLPYDEVVVVLGPLIVGFCDIIETVTLLTMRDVRQEIILKGFYEIHGGKIVPM